MEDWGRYHKCKTCGEYGWTNRHRCSPKWHAILLEDLGQYGDDPDAWHDVYGSKPEDAATKYIEKWDHEEATFSETSFVVIEDPRTGERTFHRVDGEIVPEYSGVTLSSVESAREQFKDWFTYDPLPEKVEIPTLPPFNPKPITLLDGEGKYEWQP